MYDQSRNYQEQSDQLLGNDQATETTSPYRRWHTSVLSRRRYDSIHF